MQPVPEYWKTDLETIARMAQGATRAQVWQLAASAGGRPIYAFAYGEKQSITSRANYNSACGARDLKAFADVEEKRPVILLIGAEHGFETEGTAAIVNLISLMETGKDLSGVPNGPLVTAAQGIRLVMVPVLNVDGRARVKPSCILGMRNDEMRHWGQGNWLDGSLCGWPDCKKIHPIKEAVSFLGGYYNDDGINPMHDQFFNPMGPEAKAVLDLAAGEFADCILHLHGGSNSRNALLQPAYVPVEINEAVRARASRCDGAARAQGLSFEIPDIPGKEHGCPPPSFNLASAAHHVCGGISAVFESNQCIVDEPGPHFTVDEVYRSHMILLEQCFTMMAERMGQ